VLCTSRYTLEEARANLNEENQRRRLIDLAKKLHLLEADPRPIPHGVSFPEKDIPIVMAALAARTTHLLTGDLRHFGPYLAGARPVAQRRQRLAPDLSPGKTPSSDHRVPQGRHPFSRTPLTPFANDT